MASWRPTASCATDATVSRRLHDGVAVPHHRRDGGPHANTAQARFSLVVLSFMWFMIGSKEIPNIATNWLVCVLVLTACQYPVMKEQWKHSYTQAYKMAGLDPATGEAAPAKKTK
jgi:hypothetical protein